MGQKCAVLVLYYEEEQEEAIKEELKGFNDKIKDKVIDFTNPYAGAPGNISDQIQEMCARSDMTEEP